MADDVWPVLPTETEIYILPNGEIVVADLPDELAARLAHLVPHPATRCAENTETFHVAQQQHPADPA